MKSTIVVNYFRDLNKKYAGDVSPTSNNSNDIQISNDILNVIHSIINDFKTQGIPLLPTNNGSKYQIIVDMVYDYLFTMSGLPEIINVFKVKWKDQNAGNPNIIRSNVRQYYNQGGSFFGYHCKANLSVVLSNEKAALDKIAGELKQSSTTLSPAVQPTTNPTTTNPTTTNPTTPDISDPVQSIFGPLVKGTVTHTSNNSKFRRILSQDNIDDNRGDLDDSLINTYGANILDQNALDLIYGSDEENLINA